MNLADRIWGRRVRRWIRPIQAGLGDGVELRVSRDDAFVRAVDGFEYVFDPELKFAIPNSLLKGGDSIDRERFQYVRERLPKDAVVVDAGAGVGDYSMHLSRFCREVHAFEPMERSFARLRRNLVRNGITNVFANKLAVWDRSGPAGLTDLDVEYNSLVPADSPKAFEPVQAVRLDEYLGSKSVTRVDLIVADIQGSEFQMVRGLGKFMDFHPLLLLEVFPACTRHQGYEPREFFEYLVARGYSWKAFSNDIYCFEHASRATETNRRR